MAEPDDPADAAARLEQALERIAALSSIHQAGHQAGQQAVHQAAPALTMAPPNFDTDAVAARLDGLIARIREILDHPSEG